MIMDTVLTSVGIDVGTTTTKLIVSKLTFSNIMPGHHVPKIEISKKQITYIGNVYFTPYQDRKNVDAEALRNIIAREYANVGLKPEEVDTGAIIITGEAAKKDNASEIVHSISKFAGDFVVATAGPDLESIIAGKGSGAEELSRHTGLCVANIDIGGGTTNISLIDRGKCIGTACVNVGGRLLEVDPITRRISYTAPPAQKVLEELQREGVVSPTTASDELAMIKSCLAAMVACVERVILHEPLQQLDKYLVMTNVLPSVKPDAVVFSGGVSKYIYQSEFNEWWVHGDVGPLLAEAYLQSRIISLFRVLPGKETIHATVMGAGAHTVNVSGSTISVSPGTLPIRNVPVVYPDVEMIGGLPTYSWSKNAALFHDSLYSTVALVVPALPDNSFATIVRLAQDLVRDIPEIKGNPAVVIAQQDIAKVLGQSLQLTLGKFPLVCLDGISLQMGDYLDISRPLPHQDAVPVIVKTLVFSQ